MKVLNGLLEGQEHTEHAEFYCLPYISFHWCELIW